MKETKKQIKAQLTNEIAGRFNKRIKDLEVELKCVRNELKECDRQRRLAEREALELRDKVEQYEDWNLRLQEFMDMDPDERQRAFDEMKKQKARGERIDRMLNIMSAFTHMY